MIEILKFLVEQPSKLGLFTLNILRLLLTAMIANGVPCLFKYNFPTNLVQFDGNYHIAFVFLYLLWIAIIWIVIWELFESSFSFLIILRKTKDDKSFKNEMKKEQKTIGELLKWFGVVSVENGDFEVPRKRLHDVSEILSFINETNSLNIAKSVLSRVLYLLFVGWLYFMFNVFYFHVPIWCYFLVGGLLIIMVILIREFDKFILAVDYHSENLKSYFDRLKYRKLVMDTIIQDFRGHLNLENKSFDFYWGTGQYQVFDYYYYHGGLGNVHLLKKMRSANQKNIDGEVAFRVSEALSFLKPYHF